MKIKKYLKAFGGTLLTIFVLLNVVVCFHAYKMTHFTTKRVERLEDNNAMSASTKIKTILFGVENSRPQNAITPAQKFETIKLKSNVMLECWTINTDNAKGTVIIFHGYRAAKSQMIDRSDEFLKMGYNTMLVDFMGSGGSEGNYTTIGFEEAQEVKTCFDYVASKGEKHIYLMGTSMGAVSIMKAINDYHLEPTAVLLECPFGSMYKTVGLRVRLMGLHTFPTTPLLMFWGGIENGFWAFSHNPTEYAKSIKCPALLLWGESDIKVSREETDEIYANLPGKKQLVTYPLSGHEDYLIKYHDKWVRDVSSFLQGN